MEKKKHQVLVYDAEHLLQELLEEFSNIFNFSYSVETDLIELYKNQSKHSIDSLVLIEKESPEALFQFLTELQSPHYCVAYIAKVSSHAQAFQKLKQELHVDYVLQQPLDKNEIAALFRKMCNPTENGPQKQEYLTPALLQQYKEKIFQKIERIEELVLKIGTASNFKDNLLELRNEVHKISGNAAPYGYPEAGKLCMVHEIFLHNLYAGIITREVSEIILQNEVFLRKLKLFFQNINPRFAHLIPSSEAVGEKAKHHRRFDEIKEGMLIHLLTADFDLARYFQSSALKKHLYLEIEDNPEIYLQKHNSLQKLPNIIVVEEKFPFTKWKGLDVINELRAKHQNEVSLFVIITEWDNLDKRLEWMQSGVDLVLKKPITEASVEYLLTHAMKKKLPIKAKVLIVDDDEVQGLLIKNILESIQVSAFYLQDETKLFSALEEFEPDLLLLDIQMPKYDGKFLLSALREDIRFKHLIIVIITALSSTQFDEWAYQAHCDAIIHKPVNIPIFLARITSLLARREEFSSSKELDPLTGLLLKEPLLSRIEQFVAQSPEKMKCAFVLLQIKRWENLMGALKMNEVRQILLLFSELLKSHFFASLFVGIFAEGCFAFLFKDLTGGEIEFLLDSFYEKIRAKIWLSSQTQLKISAHSSIVLFIPEEIELNQVIEEARGALIKAEEQGDCKTLTVRIGDNISSLQQGRKLILVDDDVDLCEIVQFAFEKHGFTVQAFHTAATALHFFAQLHDLGHYTLIILDRRLPDGDGVDILRKIQDKFPGNIKAIFLSSLSTEKEVLESLRSGAMDYITKPFSLDVLIEKASILLNK